MSASENPEQPPKPVGELLSSPELADAVTNDDCRRFLDHVPVGIAISRRNGAREQIAYANSAFETLAGLAFDQMRGKSWSVIDSFVDEENGQRLLGQALTTGEDFLGTFRRAGAGDGETTLAQAYVGIVENEDGSENFRVVALVDVTHYERTQRDDYERQIRDKDLQLRELQHRVKNNLQLITSLIRLEARSVQRGAKVDLDRLAGRIEALSLLYRTLEADSFGPEVDLGHYLSQIATVSMKTHAVEGIELEARVGYAPVSVNIAMPAGLLVNELMTNAFKYAFEGRERGTITIEVMRDGEQHYRLAVADDGVGLAPGLTWPVPGKLASLVVQTLRENAKNVVVQVESGPRQGMRVVFEFDHRPPSARPN